MILKISQKFDEALRMARQVESTLIDQKRNLDKLDIPFGKRQEYRDKLRSAIIEAGRLVDIMIKIKEDRI
jgi:hypothetical protein